MKKHYTVVFVGFTSMMLLFSSCKKDIGAVNPDEELGTPLPTTGLYCRIESIWEHPGAADQKFWLIAYDEFENPKFITTPVPSTGSPFRIFKYDHWHRLREFVGDYGNGLFEEWHFYGYDLNGRIGFDTTYVFGQLLETPTNPVFTVLSRIEYDNQGRIIREFGTHSSGGPFDIHYSYDASGNRVQPGVTYDTKINLNRTNDIWMFLRRDYSMNNHFAAITYNATGFPMVINNPSAGGWLTGDLGNVQIGYSCRQSFYH
jgi:hypothetical protein